MARTSSTLEVTDSYPTPKRAVLILLSLALGTFLFAIDTTIIAVAVPTISSEFQALDQVGWYGSAYLLVVTAFQPVLGNVYKYWAPKPVYLVSVGIFEVGSTLCAAAPSSPIFILGRAIAGVGAAGIIQGGLTIVTFMSPLEKRPMNLALVVSTIAVAAPLGPVLGGILTDRVGWRWCFWINLPAGFVVCVLALIGIRVPIRSGKSDRSLSLTAKLRHFDFAGFILMLGAVCSLFLALQWGVGRTRPWNSSVIIGLFVGAGLLLIVFILVEWKRGDDAMIPGRILKQRSIYMGSAYLFLAYMSSYTWDYYLAFYFQAVQGATPIISGVRMLPMAVASVVAIMFTGALTTKTGIYVPFMVIGQIICAIGTGCMSRLTVHTSLAQLAGFMTLAAFGLGMGQQLPYIAIQAALDESDAAVGNGIVTLFSQLGGALTLSIAESIFVAGLFREVPRLTTAVSPEVVIDVGVAGLTTVAPTPTVLLALKEAYAISISNTITYSLAVACAAVPCACCMQWLNVKKIAEARKAAENDNNNNNNNVQQTVTSMGPEKADGPAGAHSIH